MNQLLQQLASQFASTQKTDVWMFTDQQLTDFVATIKQQIFDSVEL